MRPIPEASCCPSASPTIGTSQSFNTGYKKAARIAEGGRSDGFRCTLRLAPHEYSTNKKFHWNSNIVECSGTNLSSLD
jgi:hypothetical protein